MPAQISLTDTILIDNKQYGFAKSPIGNWVYLQEGGAGTVYKLLPKNKSTPDAAKISFRTVSNAQPPYGQLALKVFRVHKRSQGYVDQANAMTQLSQLPGLTVCRQSVLGYDPSSSSIGKADGLILAMPWIDGETWADVVLHSLEISPELSIRLGRSLVGVMAGLEREKIAHCDVASGNVIIRGVQLVGDPRKPTGLSCPDVSSVSIELVDVEDMYKPEWTSHGSNLAGTPGYGHPDAKVNGLWYPEADRFAGAVMIAEMLAWCHPRVRENSFEFSYFSEGDLAKSPAADMTNTRYQTLIAALAELYGHSISDLLIRAWNSRHLSDCASFQEWYQVMPAEFHSDTSSLEQTRPAKRPTPPADENIGSFIAEADRLAKNGDKLEAIAAYQRALGLAVPGSGQHMFIKNRLDALLRQSPLPSPAAVKSPSQTSGKPLPDNSWRIVELLKYVGLFVGLAILSLLIVPAVLEGAKTHGLLIPNPFGLAGTQAGGAAIAATLVGLVMAWRFSTKFKSRRTAVWFVVLTMICGGVAGILGSTLIQGVGRMFATPGLRWAFLGAFMGAVSGGLSGLAHTSIMRAHGVRIKYVTWNLASWLVCWGAGWSLSVLIPGPAGAGFGLAVILIGIGVSSTVFLVLTPQLEF